MTGGRESTTSGGSGPLPPRIWRGEDEDGRDD